MFDSIDVEVYGTVTRLGYFEVIWIVREKALYGMGTGVHRGP